MAGATVDFLSIKHPVHPLRGYIYIACSAVFWGISASLGRAAFTGRLFPSSNIAAIDPLILSQARTTFSFLLVGLGLVLLRGPRALRLPWQDFAKLLVLGLLGVAASNYFYYLAIQRTNVATAIIVQYTAPIWVLLYTLARRIEKPTVSKLVSVVLAIGGIALVIGLFGHGQLHLDQVGIAAALIAAFSFAYYNVGGHYLLARYDRWMVLLYTTLSASLFWVCVNPPPRIVAAHYSPGAWFFLFAFSVLSVLIPFTFYFAGLEHLQPTKAIIASCLEPVFTVIIAAVALQEVVRPLQAVGIAMVLVSILVVQRSTTDVVCSSVDPVD